MDSRKLSVGPIDVELIGDDRICAHLDAGKRFEPETLALWAELCLENPGSQVADIGAYSGLFSIAAAKLGCKPRAFEPLPAMITRLEENIKLNGVIVSVVRAAASNIDGRANLTVNPRVHLTSGASLHDRGGSGFRKVRVKTCRVDSLSWLHLKAVKIDAEHHEAEVILGGLRTFALHRPVIIVEVLSPEAAERVTDLLGKTHSPAGLLDARNLVMKPTHI